MPQDPDLRVRRLLTLTRSKPEPAPQRPPPFRLPTMNIEGCMCRLMPSAQITAVRRGIDGRRRAMLQHCRSVGRRAVIYTALRAGGRLAVSVTGPTYGQPS